MVLPRPLLGFSKSTTSRNRRLSSSANSSTTLVPTPTSISTSSASSSTAATASSSSTLIEALRNNPFGTTSRSKPNAAAAALPSEEEERRRELEELNHSLVVLSDLFPDVKVEVFRELLGRFDGKSRLHVCVEQLLRHRAEWVKGRWNVPSPSTDAGGVSSNGHDGGDNGRIPEDERFRSDEYKKAVKSTLSQEFQSISRSAIDAVLAEVNFSYTRARPTLRHLSRKTWRATLGNIFTFKKNRDKDGPPFLAWERHPNGDTVPFLRQTGCAELDKELYDSFIAPVYTQRRERQEEGDLKLAEELNEFEAKSADALYECDCCLSDVTFEQISMCSTSSHAICFSCIQRTIQEALFGQGWSKSINPEKSTLRCLAPVQQDICEGSLDTRLVKRAVLADKAGCETYSKFEDRIAEDSLFKSQLKLVRCPFCSYAEVDSVYHPSSKGVTWRFRRVGLFAAGCMTIFLLDLIPILFIICALLFLICPGAISTILKTSLQNLCLKMRNQRFICANPSCRRQSCITCHKPWQDPHLCHEPLLLSLRTTVEAARTAAIKRTCPRCGLSFVKSSGCNKLTCVCGYSMCYICRKALGPPLRERFNNIAHRPRRRAPARLNNLQENVPFMDGAFDDTPDDNRDSDSDNDMGADEDEEPEGYKHFCEHFRANPGSRCSECNKCDLYQTEDEEAVAQRAGQQAEREWRSRQGSSSSSSNPGFSDIRIPQYSYGQATPATSYNGLSAPWEWNWQFNGGDWKGRWRFWMQDLWQDERWKGEAQYLVDRLVETVVVVDT